MRCLLLIPLLVLLGGWIHGITPSQFVLPLKIGAGGWLVGIDVNPDGTKLARTDTYGAYIWRPTDTSCGLTGCWVQLKTQSGWPATNFGYVGTGTSQIRYNGIAGPTNPSGGVYEIVSDPRNSSIIWMMVDGWIFKSTNQGTSFSLTGSGSGTGFNSPTGSSATPVPMATNGASRECGRKMAVDPANSSILYAGTDTLGLFVTTDGGASYGAVSGVPTGTGIVNYSIAFDPTSGSSGTSQTIYASTNGATAGVYVSTNAGANWTLTTGSPATICHMVVDQTGVVWATDGVNGGANGNLWKLASSGATWSKVTSLSGSATAHSVAVDPVNANHIVVGSPGGAVSTSIDGGANWTSYTPIIRSATDIPWLAAENELSMSNGDMIFDPSNCAGGAGSCSLIFGEGIGVWSSNPPNSAAQLTWTSFSAGIEQLVSRDAIAPNGHPVVGVSDRSTWNLTSPGTYPAAYNSTYQNSFSLNVTWALDWATSDSSFMAGVIGDINGSAPFDNSGTSSDGGATWYPFNSYFQDVASSALSNGTGSTVRIALPSTAGLTTWAAGAGTLVRIIPYNPTINSCSIGSMPNVALRKYWPVTVDPVAGAYIELQGSTFSGLNTTCGRLMVFVATNPLTDNNGNYTITNVTNNGSGLVRVSVTTTSSAGLDGTLVRISGVTMSGSTVVNGEWVVVAHGSTFIDLGLSSFVGGDSYVGGGKAEKFIPQGGAVAAASPNNMIVIGGGQDYPNCTTDGGLTWNQFRVGTGGWVNASFLNRHIAAADRVTPNRMYLYNSTTGTYTIDNCVITATNSAVVANSNFNATLRSVPFNAGHLFLAIGPQGGSGPTVFHPSGGALRWSQDAGATWTAIATTAEPIAVAVGAIAPGSDYPTVYMVGWVNNVYGVWRTTGTLAQWQSGSGTGTSLTWTKVADYPLGSMDSVTTLAADRTVWNKWYLGWGGSGFTYGQQNFLLKRDLDPASNDNSPMWLDKAA